MFTHDADFCHHGNTGAFSQHTRNKVTSVFLLNSFFSALLVMHYPKHWSPKACRECVATYHIWVIWRRDSLVVEVVPVNGGKEHVIFYLQLQKQKSWHINSDAWPDKQFHNDKDLQRVTHKISYGSYPAPLIFLQESTEQVTWGLGPPRWQLQGFMQDRLVHLRHVLAVERRLFDTDIPHSI